MQSKILILIGLSLFVLVLIGVTVIEPISNQLYWIHPLVPMIVITGFFTFIIAAALFLYGLMNILKKRQRKSL